MFKHMPDSALILWLTFFNNVWSGGRFPEDWKLACVIPLHKHGKYPNDPKQGVKLAVAQSPIATKSSAGPPTISKSSSSRRP